METIIAVIDAAGVRSGRVEPNKEIFTENGFLILEQLKTVLTEEQAASLVTVTGEQFDFLSGPVVALMLRREGAYDQFNVIKKDLDNTYASTFAWGTLRDTKIFFPTTPILERTLVLIKPEYTDDDHNTIHQTIDENGFTIVGKLTRIVFNDIAAEMFGGRPEDIAYVTSDVSVALVLEKIGAVDDWQLLMGPDDPVMASVVAPTSLRSRLNCQSAVKNVLYGSESVEKARRDIAALFPAPFAMERTLAIVKPDVVRNGYLAQVMNAVKANGFTVLASEEMNISKQRALQSGIFGTEEDAKLMSSGPSQVMVLGKPGAVQAWKYILGPEDPREAPAGSLRACFGLNSVSNGFHGSTSAAAAKAEIDFFFPQLTVEKLPDLKQVEELLNRKEAPRPHVEQPKSLNDVLTEGLIQLCRVKPTGNDAITWLGEWLLRNNPRKPAVAVPEDAEVEATVFETIAARTGRPTQVMWSVGGPASRRDEQVAQVSKKFGLEVIDVATLLSVSEASGSQYGQVITDCLAKGVAIPTHIVVNLVKDALLSSQGASRFLVNGFPQTMDQALMFEQVIGEVSALVYFDNVSGVQNLDGEQKKALAQTAQDFKLEVRPVIDHYALHSKLKKISTDGSASQIAARLKKVFA